MGQLDESQGSIKEAVSSHMTLLTKLGSPTVGDTYIDKGNILVRVAAVDSKHVVLEECMEQDRSKVRVNSYPRDEFIKVYNLASLRWICNSINLNSVEA